MAFRKSKAAAKPAVDAAEAPQGISEIVSIDHTPDEATAKLLTEINDLRSQLQVEKAKRGEAEQAALDAAQSQGGIFQTDVQEVPTGKTVKVQRLDPETPYKVVGHHDDGREILKPQFVTVELPTFFYKIDMPPVGGSDLKINGKPYYHGTVYKFDRDTLSTVKEMIARVWDHDKQIHGTDENAYRKPQRTQISARGMAAA